MIWQWQRLSVLLCCVAALMLCSLILCPLKCAAAPSCAQQDCGGVKVEDLPGPELCSSQVGPPAPRQGPCASVCRVHGSGTKQAGLSMLLRSPYFARSFPDAIGECLIVLLLAASRAQGRANQGGARRGRGRGVRLECARVQLGQGMCCHSCRPHKTSQGMGSCPGGMESQTSRQGPCSADQRRNPPIPLPDVPRVCPASLPNEGHRASSHGGSESFCGCVCPLAGGRGGGRSVRPLDSRTFNGTVYDYGMLDTNKMGFV